MKKRIFCLILALVMVLSLAACAGSGNDNTENTKDTTTNTEGSEATTPVSGGEAELALITDANSIDDRGFNQFSWEGLKQYAEENGKTYTYYTPIDQSTQSYLSAIEGAVNNGAKLIVTPGFLFGEAIYKAQTMYPDVHFVLVDATPTLDDDTVIAHLLHLLCGRAVRLPGGLRCCQGRLSQARLLRRSGCSCCRSFRLRLRGRRGIRCQGARP